MHKHNMSNTICSGVTKAWKGYELSFHHS